jgi:hypothetical protein
LDWTVEQDYLPELISENLVYLKTNKEINAYLIKEPSEEEWKEYVENDY